MRGGRGEVHGKLPPMRICVMIILLATRGITVGQTTQATQPTDPTARTTTRPATTQAEEKGDRLSVSRHSVRVNGKSLTYTATAGTMAQKDESGATKADMFFVSYALDQETHLAGPLAGRDRPAPTTRPVTFVFNGGPGAASVWLHLGTAGPKRISLGEDIPSAPPFELVENEATWLDATDLVFIDPVGTGYSRPAQGEKGEQFYGVQEDIRSVGAFIRVWITRNGRWPSPKFLAGESYGTTRAAGLSEYLLEKQGISLNGIILISAVLNFQTIIPGNGNDLPYALYLPSYTAAALHHKRLGDDFQRDPEATMREVEQFSLTEYQAALAKGDSLGDEQRKELAERLARYTGLSAEWIDRANLRIDPTRFRKQLLAEQKKLIGRFDARIEGFDADPANDNADYDPSLSLFLPLYTATLSHYVRTELDFESDLPYDVLTERVHPWNFGQQGRGGGGFLYVADTLRDTMLKNPQLRLLVAAGKLDLATPYLAGDYTIDHLGLPPELRKQVTRTYYPAGHMMYHDADSRRKLHEDLAGFIRSGVSVP